MFIFDRCHQRWAAETPDKHEHEWKYLAYTFADLKFFVTAKLTNGALVIPPQQVTFDNDSGSSVGQVSEYESDSDSEGEWIKDIGNMIAPPRSND